MSDLLSADQQAGIVAVKLEGAIDTLAARLEGSIGMVTADLRHVTQNLAQVTHEVSNIARENKAITEKIGDIQRSFVNAAVYERRHKELQEHVDARDKEVEDRAEQRSAALEDRVFSIERTIWWATGVAAAAGAAAGMIAKSFIHSLF